MIWLYTQKFLLLYENSVTLTSVTPGVGIMRSKTLGRYLPTCQIYEGGSIKNQPNLFLGEIDLFFFDVIAL